MIYCFAKELKWDYSKREMEISKKNGNGILYDTQLHLFLDFDHNPIDIAGSTIFPRTGVTQIYDMIDDIIKQGGIPAFSKEEVNKVDQWPKYYQTNRKMQILKGKELIDPELVDLLEATYGEEIFLKTVDKDFSSVIPIDLLKDPECAFYKALEYHLDEDFIISETVHISEDEYGKKEYRCFIVDNQIYNISRFTTDVFHQIDEEVVERLQEIVATMKNVFPHHYVVDLFEYQVNGENYIDVVEFNSIESSGLFLYNSCMEQSNDLLHKDPRSISHEFIHTVDECKAEGSMINDRNNLYDVNGSFSNDLRGICVFGERGGWTDIDTISVEDFRRHKPMLSLENAIPLEDDSCLYKELTDKEIYDDAIEMGLSEDLAKQLIKQLKEAKK